MIDFIVEFIQSLFLIIAAIIIMTAAIGIFRFDDKMDKVIYVRMHMFGMMDIACVLGMIGLDQLLLAGIYFILAPFLVHAMANAYYYSEDERKYEITDELTGRIDDDLYNKLSINKDSHIDSELRQNLENIGSIKSTNSVLIKEVGTDDIENNNLNLEREKKHD